MQNNKLIIITAPSGAGKTSIVHFLLNKHDDKLCFSISATTRHSRENEINGTDYYFINENEFNKKISENEFVEWEMVYEGKYYGTLKQELERIWKANKTPVLDIDVKGAVHVQQQFLNNSLSIFIEPPTLQILEDRLKARGTETIENLQIRLDKAHYELSFKNHFNESVINDNFEIACTQAEALVLNFIEKKL